MVSNLLLFEITYRLKLILNLAWYEIYHIWNGSKHRIYLLYQDIRNFSSDH